MNEETAQPKYTNRLIHEKSPYLLQHAHNPVDWFAWGEEAFEKAKAENKPVFVSIGYATCHWCHVMEEESFQSEEVAALLNGHFVAIKVDREERPDIDTLYMAVCQAMTGGGGWPLTVVLTPEKKPFFAGTYFPKRRMMGQPGLIEVLEQIRLKWGSDRDKLTELGDELLTEIEATNRKNLGAEEDGELSEELLHQAFRLYSTLFDYNFGGFGQAPKFPTPHNLSFLLAYSRKYDQVAALDMAEKTLDAMSRGGIFDHIGFGFARYSTDDQWLVPHFEKMLYDNALLTIAYLDAFQLTDKPMYAEVAQNVLAYVKRELTSPEGGFYSAEDADADGVEGGFYIFSREEIEEALGLEDMHSYCRIYGITEEGISNGFSIPNLLEGTADEFANKLDMEPLALRTRMDEWREKLFAYREQRVHPSKDDKVLTSWNGLMIAALAKGAKALQEPEYAAIAEKAANFIWENLRREDGRLLARYRDGEAAHLGYVDDYTFLMWGLTELYEATGEAVYLKWALELKDGLLSLFLDEEEGGFFFSGRDAEQLPVRGKELYDGAMPSGNSVAVKTLWKLAAITQDVKLKGVAEQAAQVLARAAAKYPASYGMFLLSLLTLTDGGSEWVLAGRKDDPAMHSMIALAQQAYQPEASLLIHWDEPGDELAALLPHVQDKKPLHGQATAYVCKDFTCREPITGLEAVRELLAKETPDSQEA
ncbi:thioredoxin domain-containing protein [Paenibacillus sp. HN-1]|uniref:thioredoxin domain-containing protein n=1 Tax=Paenibacillus TaxID=44249 RepID=UPI001CAA11D0|nr:MULTISPECIES: thioredoxin domain-containing protein [Paenibacillus]MBY9081827.1 thioredoxin domain-containing protein [Paenibacillus sp. CGMCC 1.18879]MBY9088118.1 thioredoxin domain-containing protein [Paenibacillus sinensis]